MNPAKAALSPGWYEYAGKYGGTAVVDSRQDDDDDDSDWRSLERRLLRCAAATLSLLASVNEREEASNVPCRRKGRATSFRRRFSEVDRSILE
jgi:hypothetical protein